MVTEGPREGTEGPWLRYRIKPELSPKKRLLPQLEPNARRFLTVRAEGRGGYTFSRKAGTRGSEGLTVSDRGVGLILPPLGVKSWPAAWRQVRPPPRGPLSPWLFPRRSGELAARLETRTQEFTSPASVRPGGNARLREAPSPKEGWRRNLCTAKSLETTRPSWGGRVLLSHAK